MILFLRGHLRRSFESRKLYELLKDIAESISPMPLDIYIHTWNIIQSTVSWRPLEQDDAAVTIDMIHTYFDDMASHIKHIIIDDDRNIVLKGNLEGCVGRSRAPLLGWKRYWYGQYHMMRYISTHADMADTIVNMRFDVLENSCSFTNEQVVNFVTTLKPPFTKNVFLKDAEFTGCDNAYAGSTATMLRLVTHFHDKLDLILKLEHRIQYQEFLVMKENTAIFEKPNQILRKLIPGL